MRVFLLTLPAVAAGLLGFHASVPQVQSPATTTPTATEQSKTQWTPLFNGKDLEGWTIFPADKVDTTNTTWSVRDGILVCAGTPVGYIRTVKEYTSFELELEWRFDPKLGAGNSGVLLRVVGADQVWPKSIEAQLESRSAGDIWNIGEFPMQAQASRTDGRRTEKEHATNEKPLGEWNKYSIRLDGGRLELRVNGLLQNVADHCEAVAGKIALQSEGSHIEFREIKIRSLPEVHAGGPSADHCSVVVKRCTHLGPAPYRPGCWALTFEIVVQGQPLELIGRVADCLIREGLIRPRDLAILTAPGGATIPLAPNWRTQYGPREEEFRDRRIHYADPRRSAIQLPNGEWSVQWWLNLICKTKPDGAVTVTLDGPAILGCALGYGTTSWTSAPATCTVPREQDPIKPNEPANIGAEIFPRVTVGGVATSNVVVVSPTTVTAVTPAGSDGAATAVGEFTSLNIVTPSWATLIEAVPDPAVVTDPALRAAIAASGFAWRVKDTGTNIEMLLIPPGSFTMGCTASGWYGCDSIENPTHAVTLINAFYLGRYEVTQTQWTTKMGSNPSHFKGSSYPDAASRPVEMVSWDTIVPFNTATGLRLPTEAEWEYAYRAQLGTAVTRTAFHDGTNDAVLLGNIAWDGVNSGYQTHAVGGKTANALGLHDMSGNVGEWINDWYGSTYYSSSPLTNLTGPSSGIDRVLRGGSWGDRAGGCRGSQRKVSTPSLAGNFIGFRSARSAFALLPPPTIASVSPSSGSVSTTITITGINFDVLSTVTVGVAAATSVRVVSATSITAVTPADTLGAKNDVVVSTGAGTATATNAFTYTGLWYTVLEQLPDPAVVTDVVLRDAITATGLPWRVRDNGTKIEMLLIPPGSFTMGCSPSLQSGGSSMENPLHAVTLTSAFYLGCYEVTQAEWTAKMGSNPSYFQGASYPDAATRSVERVSWTTIASFNAVTDLRLPTEAEWEYAYRAQLGTAVTRTAFHNGTNDDALLGNIAWFSGNTGALETSTWFSRMLRRMKILFSGNTGALGTSTFGQKVVGGKTANALGLHDMSGNVWEWVNDWWGNYSSSPSTNPTGPSSGSGRVLRGGSWGDDSSKCRASVRTGSAPDHAGGYVGFRSARTP